VLLALGLLVLAKLANVTVPLVLKEVIDALSGPQALLLLPLALLVALACLYNFAAIADSSVHSTVIAESVPPHILGAAYAVRSVLGFGTGVVSPVVFGWALDLTGGGGATSDPFAWGVAWATLGVGGLLGPLATWKLQQREKD
jgi:MFS family permease